MLYLLFLLVLHSACSAQLFFSEFHAVPVAGEPEWIELYHAEQYKSMHYQQLLIADARNSIKLPSFTVAPGCYIILCRDTLALRESRKIPDNAQLIEIRLPTLNNTTDYFTLRRADSSIMDSIYYDMRWGQKGISLERTRFDRPALFHKYIKASISPDSTTCGYENSTLAKDFDIAILKSGQNGQKALLTLCNTGLYTCSTLVIQIFSQDSLLCQQVILESLDSEDTVIAELLIETGSANPGWNNLRAIVYQKEQDGNPKNNLLLFEYYNEFIQHSFSINEILFDPAPGQIEFCEITGPPNAKIGLFKLTDGNDTLIIPHSTMLDSLNPYIAITAESVADSNYVRGIGKLTLNADQDQILLLSPLNKVLDSLFYRKGWHHDKLLITKGISLEKLNPELPSSLPSSWSSSGSSHTAGRANSLYIPINQADKELQLQIQYNPFNPSKHGLCLLQYTLPFRQAILTIEVWNRNGLLAATIVNTLYTSAQGSIAWQGMNMQGQMIEPGAYILRLFAVDITSGQTFQQKKAIIIGI
jgi:hypothetical protein